MVVYEEFPSILQYRDFVGSQYILPINGYISIVLFPWYLEYLDGNLTLRENEFNESQSNSQFADASLLTSSSFNPTSTVYNH